MTEPRCPLCGAHSLTPVHSTADRVWLRCDHCELIHVPESAHLLPDEEKARYDTHQNRVGDPDYCAFLDRLCQPLIAHLSTGMAGLDFGCGPGPALADMMNRRGYPMTLYDPCYEPDAHVLKSQYDFVTCTETVEHFKHPDTDWTRLVSVVRPGGFLGVMTQMVPENSPFEDWYYIRDPTHVAFYSAGTFHWLAGEHDLNPVEQQPGIVIFRRPD